MTPVRIPEAYRRLARLARDAGWSISPTRGGHLAWKPPAGRVIRNSPRNPWLQPWGGKGEVA